MSIFKRPKNKSKSLTRSYKSSLPDYVTGRDSMFTYTTHTQQNNDGSKRVYFIPVRKFKAIIKKEKKASDNWFLKIEI